VFEKSSASAPKLFVWHQKGHSTCRNPDPEIPNDYQESFGWDFSYDEHAKTLSPD